MGHSKYYILAGRKNNKLRVSDEDKFNPIADVIKKRQFACVGNTLNRRNDYISRQALEWIPQESRKRGRPEDNMEKIC